MMTPIQESFRYNPWREKLTLFLKRTGGEDLSQRLALLYHGLRYVRIMDYITIDGWLAHGEAITLYETARTLPDDRPVVCEIGSWLGKSSVVIARGLQGKSNPVLYCIDPFNADGDQGSREQYQLRRTGIGSSLAERFAGNIRKRGLEDIIRPIKAYSFDAIKSFRDPLDMLFIDGNHAYESVLRDYCDWTPLLKAGGYLAFHDVSFNNSDTGPQRVIREHILGNPAWTDPVHVQSLFVARKI